MTQIKEYIEKEQARRHTGFQSVLVKIYKPGKM